MQYTGKLCGLLLGTIIFGNWVAIIIGLLLGHFVDQYLERSIGITQKIRQNLFFYTTFQVMGHICKSKGRVTESDIQVATAAMDKMNLSLSARQEAQRAFREGKKADYPIRFNLRQFKRHFYDRQDLLKFFMEIQFEIAFANGMMHPNERKIFYVIAEELGFQEQYIEYYLSVLEQKAAFERKNSQRRYQYQENYTSLENEQQGLDKAYNILGVDPRDDMVTIKKSYRKLMNLHHPDKLLSKGLPSELMDLAKQKAQSIQSAYELIKKSRKNKH